MVVALNKRGYSALCCLAIGLATFFVYLIWISRGFSFRSSGRTHPVYNFDVSEHLWNSWLPPDSKTVQHDHCVELASPAEEFLAHVFRTKFNALKTTCKNEQRIGGGSHKSRFICLDDIKHGNCLVYTFGYESVFEFESEMAKHYECKVFTFDCTVKYIEPIKLQLPERVTFYPWCIGPKDEVKSSETDQKTHRQFYTLQTIMKKLGHRQLDLLKLDIERQEFAVISSFEKTSTLPKQLNVEFHLNNPIPMKEITAPVRYSEWQQIWKHLEHLGYRFSSYNLNSACNCCCKYTGILRTSKS